MKEFLFVTEEDEGFVDTAINLKISTNTSDKYLFFFLVMLSNFEIFKFYQDSEDAEVKKVFKNPVS